ncbi:MAG: DUF5069 domain-containing protein [Limisphaerales bacterium]
MEDPIWAEAFRAAYRRARQAYEEGAGSPALAVSEPDREFLGEIGCSPQEIFDFVEDDVTVGEPDLETALRITRVRWEYFQEVEKGQSPGRLQRVQEFPPPGETLGGIPWLPRIISKARAKLRGELPQELMFGCGGDRHFLREHGLAPDRFLEAVWKAGDNDAEILDYVRRRGGA